MKLFHIFSILISLSAVFSFINYRFLNLPTAIGLMLIAILASFGHVIAGAAVVRLARSGRGYALSMVGWGEHFSNPDKLRNMLPVK